MDLLKDLIFNNYIVIIDLFSGSLMAILGILAFGKTKKIENLFFVLASLFLYLIMISRVLEFLEIYYIKDIKFNNIPVIYYLINLLPVIFFIIGFIFILKEK